MQDDEDECVQFQDPSLHKHPNSMVSGGRNLGPWQNAVKVRNGPKIFKIYHETHTQMKGNLPLAEYFNKLQKLWDEYDGYTSTKFLAELKQLNRLMRFLVGVGDGYEQARHRMLLMDPPPSAEKAYSLLMSYESDMKRTSRSTMGQAAKLRSHELECILRKLSFLHILRFRRVCKPWSWVAEFHLSSSYYRRFFHAPWLMFPKDVNGKPCLHFFDHIEKKWHSDVCVYGEDYKGQCVGSSRGWLALLDKELNFSIFNPFSDDNVHLHLCSLKFVDGSRPVPDRRYPRFLVPKFVIAMSGTQFNKDEDTVVLILGEFKKLVFYRNKDRVFTYLDGAHDPFDDINCKYDDIMCKDNKVFALSEIGSVEMWDFRGGSPTKIMDLTPPFCPKTPADIGRYFRVSKEAQFYLVDAGGELLFVVRYRGKIPEFTTFGLFAAEFRVFRLDWDEKEWVGMESLGDQALFLGGSESISLGINEDCPAGCFEKNSIYLTDDRIVSPDQHVGIYSLEDQSMKEFDLSPVRNEKECFDEVPAALWIVPNPGLDI